MKNVFTLCLVFLLAVNLGFSQENTPKKIKAGNYLVIGAYAKNKKQLAELYANTISEKGYNVTVDFFPKKNYHFVYLKYYDDFNASIRGLYQHRKIDDFADCWVYVMRQAEVIDKALDKQISNLSDMFASRFNAVKEEASSSIKIKNDSSNSLASSTTSEDIQKERVVLASENAISKNVQKTTQTTKSIVVSSKTTPLYMSLFDAQSATEVVGEIEIVDGVNHAKIGKAKGNKVMNFRDPENGTGDIILISNVFGFKRQQLDFNYYEPLDNEDMDYITNVGDTIIVNFGLLRYRKGDFMVMYNVYFFKDAALMKPESKFEINQLLTLMKESEGLKIKIHGHTNGNAVGIIKHYNPEAKNYFSLTGATKETTGSAKKLSQVRANIIKQFLVDNGIDKDRMETKAWGGKSMIHDKHDTQAKRNVRVEIEFLTD